jgi:6-phosphogluconolactonase
MRKLFCFLALFAAVAAQGQTMLLLVGTYTNTGNLGDNPTVDSSGSKGIYLYSFDAGTGKAELLSHTEGVCNPSYLAIARDGHHVYACTESRMKGMGSVSAFELDRATGRLQFINKVSSGGDNPAYVSVDSSGHWVIVADYTGGSFVVCGIGPDGGLLPPVQRMEFAGHGFNPQRQEKSHVHSVVLSPDQQHLYVQDLGLDRITEYPFYLGGRPLPADTTATLRFTTTPGSGPRHLTFGPDRRFAYLIEEMGGMVDVYGYDAATGRLDSIQRIAAHPADNKGPFRSSDIHLSPDGRFLYASNRAESAIAIFSVDKDKGVLRPVGYTSVLGKEPRNFTVDPTGNWLLVADQESNMIVVFRINRRTGKLKPMRTRISVPLPTYLGMLN